MDPSDDETNIAWARNTFDALTPYMAGAAYVNYLGGDEADRVSAAYGPNWSRLVQLKARYDPDNIFHLNQNISPAAG
jgi:FAD/FMN-containing dehydrogenase